MIKLKYLFTTILLIIFSSVIRAQGGNNESPVGKFMRSNQRSYVVIAVMLTILAGILIYMIRLDRKINRLEKENRS